MIGLLIQLLVVAIIVGLLCWVASQIPGVAPFAHIVYVIALVIFVIYALYILLAVFGGVGVPHGPVLR